MLHNFAFKKRLHHLCAAAIAIFSYLLSGDECKAVIKTLESKSPAITPSNGQYQTAGMFCQMSRKLHKITDHRTYSSAMYFLPAGSILLFQRFLPYDSKDIICDHCQLQHQFVALKLSQRESFNIPTDVTGNDTAGMVAGMVASGVTAKGLNGIEAEANKLAKAPKGLDGVTEGTGNVAEDVGKAGKGLEGAAKGAESAAEDAGKVVESGTDSWNMVEGGGTINGREYSQHAMERMAPDTPQVRAELSRRAEKSATQRGLKVGTQEYYEYCKKYVDPRNIPPSVIEDAISSTKGIPGNRPDTFIHETADVKIVINSAGKVITVIPK